MASRRTWMKNVDYPGSLAFDMSKNNFARILHESYHGASYHKLKQDEHIMTINLPKIFRFEFELKLGSSDGTKYENFVSGKCSKIVRSYTLGYVKNSKNTLKAQTSASAIAFRLGLWDPENMKGSGIFFGELFNFVAKVDTQESLNINCIVLLFKNFLLIES